DTSAATSVRTSTGDTRSGADRPGRSASTVSAETVPSPRTSALNSALNGRLWSSPNVPSAGVTASRGEVAVPSTVTHGSTTAQASVTPATVATPASAAVTSRAGGMRSRPGTARYTPASAATDTAIAAPRARPAPGPAVREASSVVVSGTSARPRR